MPDAGAVAPLTVRPLARHDADLLADGFAGEHVRGRDVWRRRLAAAEAGESTTRVALLGAKPVGWATLVWTSGYSPFRAEGIPEIQDLVVASGARRQGIGSRLIAELEGFALESGARRIGIAVGLYRDYGAAQRLYVRLGYVPDGRGITSHGAEVEPGSPARVDDGLLMWLMKEIEG